MNPFELLDQLPESIVENLVDSHQDDFDRDVYCLFGLPFDALGMTQTLAHLRSSVRQRNTCFMSTPNLNFLIGCQTDAAFRDSVVNSDMSVADGMPLVWLARILGIPIRERVAGSEVFDRLLNDREVSARPVSVYFFGGPPGVAEQACRKLALQEQGVHCVGYFNPGFGSVEEMSGEDVISGINASGADFLVVSLGARKGQAWIERNRSRLSVPVISHLGAVVNFVAGTVHRAPDWMQRTGLEWVWRIKEEPELWRRYWRDANGLLALVLGKLIPLLWWQWFDPAARNRKGDVRIELAEGCCRVVLIGSLLDPLPAELRHVFREAARRQQDVVVDCSDVACLGSGLFGLLLMLRKHQSANAKTMRLTGVGHRLRRLFHWNGTKYLLE